MGLIFKMIKEFLNEKREEHIPSGKFAISGIGGCWRKKYLQLKGEYDEEYSEETKRIFEFGDVIHRQITRELIEKENGNFHLISSEVNIPPQKYISGRIDNIISIKGEKIIIDVKSAGDWTFRNVINNGDCDENYKNQVLLYMHFSNIHKGFLLFVGKTAGKLEEIEVVYDEEKANQLVKEIEDFFHNYVEKDICPEKCDGNKWGCACCGIRKARPFNNRGKNEWKE